MTGQVLESKRAATIPIAQLKSRNAVVKKRIGMDAQYSRGSWNYLSEISFGEDNDDQVGGIWLQAEYTFPDRQELKLQVQSQVWDPEINESQVDTMLGIGASYELSSSWTIRTGYFHDINRVDGNEDQLGVIQIYYLGL